MKKGLRAAAAVMLALIVTTGCAANKKNNDGNTVSAGTANEKLFDDMKKGESVDAATATEAFTKAMDIALACDSATIDTKTTVELTENDKTTTTENSTLFKYQPDENAAKKAESEETTAAQSDESETATGEDTDNQTENEETPMLASIEINNKVNDEENKMDGYYKDGYLYYTMDDEKVKEPVSFDQLNYVIGNYNMQFTEDVVESALKLEDKNEVKYTVKFAPDKMADMMMNNMAAGGSPMADDEDMVINEAYLYFVVDKDGRMSGYDMEIDAKFTTADAEITTEAEKDAEATTKADEKSEETTAAESDKKSDTDAKESPFKYSITTNFKDLNKTKVEDKTDLDSYRDVYDVLNEQQEAEEGTTETQEATTKAQ